MITSADKLKMDMPKVVCTYIVIVAATFLSVACGARTASAPTSPSAPGRTGFESDSRLVQAMMHQHREALQMFELCEQKSHRPQLGLFCKQLRSDHQQSLATLQNWLSAWSTGQGRLFGRPLVRAVPQLCGRDALLDRCEIRGSFSPGHAGTPSSGSRASLRLSKPSLSRRA